MADEDERTVWVGNLDSEQVTEDVLYELFLQAGPLQSVRIPKDKTTGREKNFAFVLYRDAISVPYAIELMNGIPLFDRNMRVQNRALLELQKKGCAPEPAGIHTLNPSLQNENPHNPQRNYQQPMMSCGQQYSLMGPMPGMLGLPQNMMQPPLGMHGSSPSLMGAHPGMQGNSTGMQRLPQGNLGIPASLQGKVPQHIMALAQEQIAMLQAQQPQRLSANPLLNAPSMHRADRQGSLINHNVYNQDRRSGSQGGGVRSNDSPHNHHRSGSSRPGDYHHGHHHDDRNRNSRSFDDRNHHNQHRDDRYRSSRSLDDERNRHSTYRSGGPKYIDNNTMKMFKAQNDDNVSQNSHMLAQLQQQQGRFDYSRLGPGNDNNKRGNGYNHNNYRSSDQHGSDRRDHHHDDRYHHRSDHYNRSRNDDRSSNSRYDPYRSSRR